MSDSLKVALVQLDQEAPPGLITPILANAGVTVTVHVGTQEVTSADGLILLGSGAWLAHGPLAAEVVATVRARRGQHVLGIGAGAQLLATALGGMMRPERAPEFGYVDLIPTELAAADPMMRGLGSGLPVMEWHDDAIDLPAEAEILARCLRNRVQAYRIGPNCYGLRFHPGATTEIVRRWAALRATARNNPALPVRIGAEIVRHQKRAEAFGRSVLEGWLGLVRSTV